MLAKDLEWCLSHTFRQMWLERKETNYLKRADDSEMDFFPLCWLQLALLKRHFYMSYQSTKRAFKLITKEHNYLNVGKWKRGRVGKICGSDSWMRILNCVAVKLFPCSYISECSTIIEERLYFRPAASFLSHFWLKKHIFPPPASVSSLE